MAAPLGKNQFDQGAAIAAPAEANGRISRFATRKKMHKRVSFSRMIGLAILLMGITILQGCSSDSSAGSDANDNFPFLTAQPAASPSTVVNLDTVSYTVPATGPLGLGRVTASLTPFSFGSGFGNQAGANLTETATDTWTGSATIDSAVTALLIGGEGYYLLIELAVDASGVDRTATIYTRATSGTGYTFSNHDSAFTQVGTGSSAYSVARVTVNN